MFGGLFVNMLAYADDMVLLAPSWYALQSLINRVTTLHTKSNSLTFPDFSSAAGNISSIGSFNGSQFFHINYKPHIRAAFSCRLHHYSYDHDFTYWNACFNILKTQ